MLIRGDAVTDVKFYLNEPSTSRFGVDVFNRIVNRAQRTVQNKILETTRRAWWYREGYFTWPADSISVDAAELLDFKAKGQPWKLLSHGTMDQSGIESTTNLLTPFRIVAWQQHYGQNNAIQFPAAIGDAAYVTLPQTGRQYPVTFMGGRWFMRPAPTTAIYVKAEWIPILPDIPDGTDYDSVQLLDGQLEEIHEAVVLEACLSINAARRLESDHLIPLLARHYDMLASRENPTMAEPMRMPIPHG